MDTELTSADGFVTSPLVMSEFVQWLDIGGPVVMILLAMSILALAVILLKLYQFKTLRLGQRSLVNKVLALYRAGHAQQALELTLGSGNPILKLLNLAISGCVRNDLTEAQVREEVYRVAADYLEKLRAYCRVLEVIASLAPLLGLLGTVLGMIEAFQQLQASGSRVDPSVLSGGIWEALLTTAVGLAVAIPVIVFVNLFDRILARLAHDMHNALTQIFTVALGEGEFRQSNVRVQPQGEAGDAIAAPL